MSQFRADLHIHSRFSRATSKQLTVRHLAAWALVKGIHVLGTGDFTHPAWREELRENLVEDEESGLFRLRDDSNLQDELKIFGGKAFAGKVRFMLQTEISSIYKRGGAVRKVHNLVYMPSFEAADNISQKLAEVGNIASDGRPILGLDSRNLLEMVLETDPLAYLIPAHIWTPWFALFGSKSGFNSMEECFGDLSDEIFAMETGLSSDPAMNWLWSALDRYRMVSNSDAHSGANLGRETTIFSGDASYEGIYRALRGEGLGHKLEGTLEFFPEEGKYHMDGHRKCGVMLTPVETLARGGICPVCGKPLTVGVLNRVLELADRSVPEKPQNHADFVSVVPLPELIGEVVNTASSSQKAQKMYADAIAHFGSELDILQYVSAADLHKFSPLLAESISRMRRGEVIREPGFDGEYGTVRMFSKKEHDELFHGCRLLAGMGDGKEALAKKGDPAQAEKCCTSRKTDMSAKSAETAPHNNVTSDISIPHDAVKIRKKKSAKKNQGMGLLFDESAVLHEAAVLGGEKAEPTATANTGVTEAETREAESAIIGEAETKTAITETKAAEVAQALEPENAYTLDGETSNEQGEGAQNEAEQIFDAPRYNAAQTVAVEADDTPLLVLAGPGTGKTHTLIGRMGHLLSSGVPASSILALTFTRRAAAELTERLGRFCKQKELPQCNTLHALAFAFWAEHHNSLPLLLDEDAARRVFAEDNPEMSAREIRESWQRIMLCREQQSPCSDEDYARLQAYTAHKAAWNLADYTDLLEFFLEQVEGADIVGPWSYILVDEVQDLSPLQLSLIKELVPVDGRGFFGIGDPQQSIYGFRGAHGAVQEFFAQTWQNLRCVSLQENYRSAADILQVAADILPPETAQNALVARASSLAVLREFSAPSAESEAAWIAEQIHSLIGATSHTLNDALHGKSRSAALQGKENPLEGTLAPGDIAVLVRVKALAPLIRNTLTHAGIPCSIPEAEAFWKDPRVRAILAAAGRMLGIEYGQESGLQGSAVSAAQGESEAVSRIVCPDDMLAKGPLGVAAYCKEMPPFDVLFWKSTAFKRLLSAYTKQRGWSNLLSYIHLQSELELVRSKCEKVQIMTMHAAKGLEFPAVFLPALEEGLLPLADFGILTGNKAEHVESAEERKKMLAEEQRLFFVGATRARQALFLSHAATRRIYGKSLHLPPSRFLQSITKTLLCRSKLVAHVACKKKQLSLLS